MARRGDELREHILFAAKDVFLEMGFERASMDAVAAHAETSKRSLYAHFENKEKLFLEVVELVRGLFLNKLKTPGEYSDRPEEAVVRFSARYLENLLYGPSVRMCRMCMAEAERFPEGAARYFDVLFETARERLGGYLRAELGLTAKASAEGAERLLAQVVYPRYMRALLGIDELAEEFADVKVDVRAIRRVVAEWMGAVEGR